MGMNAKLAALAATAMVLAVPALAADGPPPSGSVLYSPTPMVIAHVEMGLGATGGPSDSTVAQFVGAGRANKVLNQRGLNLQLEVGGTATSSGATNTESAFGGYAHLWTMAAPMYGLGAFSGAAFASGTTTYSLGIEGKAHLGAMTLSGMVADNLPSTGSNFWVGSVGASYYFTPNQRIGAAATFVGDNGLGVGNNVVLTADVEKRFVDPISIWGSVNYAPNAGSSGGGLWSVLAGLRVFADQPNGTLRSHEEKVPWHFTDPLRAY
jgi:hypothetical protein